MKIMKTVKLKFDNSLSSLCGNPFGKKVFVEQVKNEFSENASVEVLFPDNIDTVSMSFAQGFISEIAEKYGMSAVGKYLVIKSAHDRVNRKFNDAINMRN